MDSQADAQDDAYPDGPVDSDDEKEKVLAGISRANPQPIYQHIPFPLKRKYQHVRLKEMLANALGTTTSTSSNILQGQRPGLFAPAAAAATGPFSAHPGVGTGMFAHLGFMPPSAVLMTASGGTPLLGSGGNMFGQLHRESMGGGGYGVGYDAEMQRQQQQQQFGEESLSAGLIAAAAAGGGGREMEVGA